MKWVEFSIRFPQEIGRVSMSEDGFTVRMVEAGNTYEVADTCARTAISEGWAYEVKSAADILAEVLKPVAREQHPWLFADPFKKPIA